MRPWKNWTIDHFVCVSNAIVDGSRILSGSNISVIPNFVHDEVVLDRVLRCFRRFVLTPARRPFRRRWPAVGRWSQLQLAE